MYTSLIRPLWLIVLVILLPASILSLQAQPVGDLYRTEKTFELKVYKSPSCGCCKKWLDVIEKSGIKTTVFHPDNLYGFKSVLLIANNLRACHTAVSDNGFVFEGHIPAEIIKQFLLAPPIDAIGLAVPGMPIGSPGMEMNNHQPSYDVVLIKKDGSQSVYQHISANPKN